MKFQVELWAGEKVDVEVSEGVEIILDGVDLDPRIVEWAIQYGLRQGIRDAAAAEPEDAKRNAKAWKRIDALKTNTLREGGGGGPKLSPVDREMRNICETQVRLAFEDPANAKWVTDQRAKTGLSVSDLRDAVVKAKLAADDGTLRKQAEANIAKAPVLNLTELTINKVA